MLKNPYKRNRKCNKNNFGNSFQGDINKVNSFSFFTMNEI